MDRFFSGFFAGFLASIAMNIWSLLSYHLLQFGQVRFLDWMGIFLLGRPPVTLAEQVYSQLAQMVWAGGLGIVFAFLAPRLGAKWYLGKAVLYALALAFLLYALPVLFKVPHLAQLSLASVLSNHLGALIWGLFLGSLLPKLEGE